ncbi:MAG TPA: helix-turn-helix transcriptional regulator [Longimicrobiales bacterium]|nr:helix-turn-helix transcriptional regulator [Longimicrobiales bacterium]
MDVSLVIRRRLDELGLDQKDLARAANVTESYVSQLLTRRKAPPVPSRTDIYERMEAFLKLPAGDLARLADVQRKAELKRALGEAPTPLFHEVRDLILRKCNRDKVRAVRAVFDKQPFGELERLVTQKLLDVAKWVATEEMDDAYWLRMVAQESGRTQEEMRAVVLEFLETDIFGISGGEHVSFLEPLIESWDIDLATFDLTIVLNHPVAPGHVKQFGFVEREPEEVVLEEGLKEFLADPRLSGSATEEEVEFLKRLRFKGKRPTALFYYRELQNLRDPLHFRPPPSG